MQRIPRCGLVGIEHRPARHLAADEGQGFGLGAEHAGERLAVLAALADDYNDLPLAGLILPPPAVNSILAAVGRFHIAAEIAAVDFRPLAVAAYRGLADLGSHRLPQLVRENERALVG